MNREVLERLSERLASVLAASSVGLETEEMREGLREDIGLALASLDMDAAARALDFERAVVALAGQERHPLVQLVAVWELLAAVGSNRSEAELSRLRDALRWTLRPGFVLMVDVEDQHVGVMPTVFGGAAIHLWTDRSEPNESDIVFDYPARARAFAAALDMAMAGTTEPEGWYRVQGRGRHETRSTR